MENEMNLKNEILGRFFTVNLYFIRCQHYAKHQQILKSQAKSSKEDTQNLYG